MQNSSQGESHFQPHENCSEQSLSSINKHILVKKLSSLMFIKQGSNIYIPHKKITEYINKFIQLLDSKTEVVQLRSVFNFKNDVENNSIMRMYLSAALEAIPPIVASIDVPGETREGVLHGYSIDFMFALINIIAQTPPSFIHSEFAGVPINAIFIDLMNTVQGQAFFSLPEVNKHLKMIFDDYALMLRSKKSLKYLHQGEGGWFCQDAKKLAHYEDFVINPKQQHYGFKSWSDWFIRSLAPGARPIDGENDPLIIVNAAESYPLTTVELPVLNVQASDKFWLKQSRYSLFDMLAAGQMKIKRIIEQSFVGGTVYQAYLSPWCYHRWHSPVSGTIQYSYSIPGLYFLQNPSYDLEGINNYDNSQSFLSCVSARHVFIINTHHPRIGRVAIVWIGMVEVSSCIPIVNVGDKVTKGQQIGRFQFGGSSHVIIFDKKAKLDFNPSIYEREIKNQFMSVSIKQKVNSWLAKIIE